MKVCVIGAGPSGLATLYAFQSAKELGKDVPDVVCFEKQEDWAGLWNYTWRTGLDQYGEPVHCSMYRYLWSNAPKEALEFADYTFEEHFGKQIASYPPREVLLDYIIGRAKKSAVRDRIRFNTVVKSCVFKDGKFTVGVKNLIKDAEYEEEYDYVVVANGHFSTPNSPQFPGFDTFKGRLLHAHDFREASEFKGKDVLLIGASFSAEDIGSQCWKYGCKSVTISHRTAPTGYKWPNSFTEVPLLEKVEGSTCFFKDGSTKNVDAIILCTGYLHSFPFLEDSLRLKATNRLAINDLYKGIAYVHNPKLFFIGMQNQFFTFNMFGAQAWWARDVMLGKIKMPQNLDERLADVKKRIENEDAGENAHDGVIYQANYVKELLVESDYPPFDVDAVSERFFEWIRHKKEDIMGFRNNCYQSVITGTMAPLHHTPWMDAMDDSMKDYLQN